MKLLLTSAGVRNKGIADALQELTGKDPKDVKFGFIPIAGNVEEGNKDWWLKHFVLLQNLGYLWFDIVDPTAAEVDWQHRLEAVDVIFMCGGNTFHLLDQLRKVGFAEWFQKHKDQKVYLGVSAGTIVATPNIGIAPVDNGDPNLPGIEDLTGLGLVDFEISPHTPEMVSDEANTEYARTTNDQLYAIDDETAIKVVDKYIEVVGGGKWKIYNR